MCVPLLLTLLVPLAAGLPQGAKTTADNTQPIYDDFTCLEDGLFEDPEQCDLYWECKGSVATPHYCEDGLVFDLFKAKAGHVDPCDTPLVVDCTDRPLMQPATHPNEFCQRRHGVFPDPDPTICNRYHNCKDGYKEDTVDCTIGLHFDPVAGICTWPDAAGRVGCVEKVTECVKNGNFCCTGQEVFSADGVLLPHPSFIHEFDCQKFYICLHGKTPRESACALGQVFNDKTQLCDYPENVPECYGWYRDHEVFQDYYYDEPLVKGDVGSQDTPQ
ncbi:protein obstructor-E-like isoform X2 [Eriocheir sinensis]|uniref:protein obstructor-E-like isoform X2 n=1 Tax=Eriocheir sinensis TaxID=95602 RepID=UPI0021C6E227|nr:protein obstructor-E-like isoform X2 [Eriocheir sinensis]